MRGDQLARQWLIIRTLESSTHGITARELAREVRCSVRTLYRDLEALEYAGFPIYKADDNPKYSWMEGHRFKVPPPFSASELMSLWLYRDLLRVFRGTAWHDSLESLFRKVRASLPPGALAYMDRIQSTFSVGIKPYKEYGKLNEILNQVNSAALSKKSIEIAYYALKAESETIRKVDPYSIWFFEGTFYLIGLCHLRNEMRMFVLDRMKLVRVTDDSFTIPEGWNLDKFLQHSFKVMRDQELHTVKVRISPAWARWAGEKIWHETQKARKLSDGGLELTFQVAGLTEIKMWVMSLGKEAEVLEPKGLRLAICNDLDECVAYYAGTKLYFDAAELKPEGIVVRG
jgi:predicted DNA-binding transcriptional regulator YafY